MRSKTSPPLNDVGTTGLIVRFRILLGRGAKYLSTFDDEETLKHASAMIFPAWLTFQRDRDCVQPQPVFRYVNRFGVYLPPLSTENQQYVYDSSLLRGGVVYSMDFYKVN
jgi:hypothetical protein